MSLFARRITHRHCWGPALADVPGNALGAVLFQACTACGRRRRCRV